MKEKSLGGRPKIIFSKKEWNTIEQLCGLMCTGEEIAGVLGIDYDTLNARIKEKYDMGFSDYFKRHSAKGKISLRRSQYKVATSGNPTMLVWLGKQYLGQSDRPEEASDEEATPVQIIVGVQDGSLKK